MAVREGQDGCDRTWAEMATGYMIINTIINFLNFYKFMRSHEGLLKGQTLENFTNFIDIINFMNFIKPFEPLKVPEEP